MTNKNSFPVFFLLLLTLMVSIYSCGNEARSSHQDHKRETPYGQSAESTAAATQSENSQPVRQPGDPASTIPDFTFYILRSGIRFTKADLAPQGNRIFILFDPTCGHCQHEASELGKHYDELKEVSLYFVSMNDPALMSSFLETWAKPLVGKPNVELLYDRNADFINKFHLPAQYPAVYVYGADGRLKTFWDGERPTNAIIADLKK